MSARFSFLGLAYGREPFLFHPVGLGVSPKSPLPLSSARQGAQRWLVMGR